MGYASDVEGNAAVHEGKKIGAIVLITLTDNATGKVVMSGVTQTSADDQLEVVQIEESGESGVNESVNGRHNGSGSMSGNFSIKRHNLLPSREDNNRFFTLVAKPRTDQPDAGYPLWVLTDLCFTAIQVGSGSRGPVTVSGSFTYQRKWTGLQWAKKSGTY